MRAFTVLQTDGIAQLRLSDVARPIPARGEVTIQIKAAGVTPTELLWYPTTHKKDGQERIAAVPGHEFSGVVVELGEDAGPFAIGDAVFGMNDWFASGATAEFCVAPVTSIALKPAQLSHVDAAAVPISALTAWQALTKHAEAEKGERLLLAGAGGSVGLMAVQIATMLGCNVIASASKSDFTLLNKLGVSELIDYQTTRFEEVLTSVDIVLDTVGSDILQRAAHLLRANGRMVTIAADAEGKDDPLISKAFFIVEPSGRQLEKISGLISRGVVRPFVKAVVPFEAAPQAYLERGLAAAKPGKIVIQVEPPV